MKTNITHSSWIITVPVAALAAGYVFFFFLPGKKEADRLSKELSANRDYVVQSASTAAAIVATQKDLADTLAHNRSWSQTIPKQDGLADLFGKISALAEASGNTTTRFDPEPPVAMDKLSRVPVAVGCTGTFSQIADFLQSLESLPEPIWVDTLEIERVSKDGGAVDCQVNMMIFTDNLDSSDQVDLAG